MINNQTLLQCRQLSPAVYCHRDQLTLFANSGECNSKKLWRADIDSVDDSQPACSSSFDAVADSKAHLTLKTHQTEMHINPYGSAVIIVLMLEKI